MAIHVLTSLLAGWRSWNAFGSDITEQTFYDAIDAITARKFQVDGANVSLADVGYDSVGIDEVCLSPAPCFTLACPVLHQYPAEVTAAARPVWLSGMGGLRPGLQRDAALRQRHAGCERV